MGRSVDPRGRGLSSKTLFGWVQADIELQGRLEGSSIPQNFYYSAEDWDVLIPLKYFLQAGTEREFRQIFNTMVIRMEEVFQGSRRRREHVNDPPSVDPVTVVRRVGRNLPLTLRERLAARLRRFLARDLGRDAIVPYSTTWDN